MNIIQKRHILDSVWHYRLDTEKNDIRFLLGLELKGKTVIDIVADRGICSDCDEFTDVVFIKCDVEGHEHNVFRGGRRLLERDRPCLLFECHRDEAEKQALFSFLTSLNNSSHRMTHDNKL
jgi:hypothetical protein